jgi:predicted nucleotidyltransferase
MLIKDSITKTIQDYFSNKPVNNVWLFGSFARNDFDEKSDVDILVDIDFTNMKSGWDFVKWHLDIEKLIARKVEVVSTGGLNERIRPYVEKDKQLIYAK